jgi:hypothetical protein
MSHRNFRPAMAFGIFAASSWNVLPAWQPAAKCRANFAQALRFYLTETKDSPDFIDLISLPMIAQKVRKGEIEV